MLYFACFFAQAQIDDSKIKLLSASNGQQEAARYARLLQESYANGDYELQKEYSDSLFLVAEVYAMTDMSIMALNSQAIYYKNKGNRKKALEIYHIALQKCDLIPSAKGPKTMILVNMANIYTAIGSYEKSVETMDTLLKVTDTIEQFYRIKASALVGQSVNYMSLDNNAEATYYAQKALDLGSEMGDEDIMITAYNTLSDIYSIEKNYEGSLEFANKGLLLETTQKPTKKRAGLLLNRGMALFHLLDYKNAINSLEESLRISQDKGLQEIQMYCYEYLSKIFEKREEFEKSVEAQKEYARLRDSIQDDKKETVITDLEKEISNTQEILDSAKIETDILKQKSIYARLFLISTLVVMSGILLFFIKKKKRADQENRDLQKEFTLLKQKTENENPRSAEGAIESEIFVEESPYKNSALTKERRLAYKKDILHLMKAEKPYLNPELRLNDLALRLNMSPSHFSEVLHYSFNENFYNFINFHRVLEAQELLKKPSYKEAKIITIAFDAGFKSKTTFNRVFKSYTGSTPSEYRKKEQF